MSDSEQQNNPNGVGAGAAAGPDAAAGASSTWDDARITAYVMGELSDDELSAFGRMMSDDPELAAAVDQARQVTEQLQVLYAGETPNTLDGSRRNQILAASMQPGDAVGSTLVTPDRSTRRWVPWVLAAAAALLIAFGVIPKMQQARIAQYDANANRDGFSGHSASESAVESSPSELNMAMDVDPDGKTMTADDLSDDVMNLKSGADAAKSLGLRLPARTKVAPRKNDVKASRESIPAAESTPFAPADAPVELELTETLSVHDKRLKRSAGLQGPLRAAHPMDSSIRDVKTEDRTMADSLGELSKHESDSKSNAEFQVPPASRRVTVPAGTEANHPVRMLEEAGSVVHRLKTTVGEKVENDSDYVVLPRTYRDANLFAKLKWQRQDGDRFEPIVENGFRQVSRHPLSTLSVDVDTASYSKVRRSLVEGRLPRPDAVRIEELINYFEYNYDAPEAGAEHPFAADVTITGCPWNPTHRLARVAIQGKTLDRGSRPPCNLVFLLDTSGSMNQPNKLPLVVEGMKMLAGQLGKEDRVAIVVYAGSAGLVLDSTPANKQKKIAKALSSLSANGSTAGGAGIRLAYATARDHFIKDGVNRVVLCTDGDFNVGMSGTDELVRLIQDESSDGIFLTALGFGMGNHNDAMMEQISGKGNGNYAFIDTVNEAHKVLVRQTDATLVTIAKDVKLQIEFNPRVYSQYRLIGYENRVMAKEDFNDDKKDAGEIGAGHQVTALYELVPSTALDQEVSDVDPLKYQTSSELTEAAEGDDAMTVKLRYKLPSGEASTLIQLVPQDSHVAFDQSDTDFQFAASVASFGMLLRQSEFAGDWSLQNVRRTAKANLAGDEFRLRDEFVQLVKAAEKIRGE